MRPSDDDDDDDDDGVKMKNPQFQSNVRLCFFFVFNPLTDP